MNGESSRIELSGEYDLQRRDEVRRIFGSLDCSEILLDFHDVTYVDSSFLNELVVLRNRLPESSITLVVPSAQIRRILEIVDFGRIFTIVNE